ncbi:MAG: hypothetical protein GX851_07545 [Clostridiales bacterium]|nr:hypothetical protein [Clostridiales bacterium]
MNILEELYYGNITPWENGVDPKSEYARFAKILCDSQEKLTAFLNGVSEPGDAPQWLSHAVGFSLR